MIKNFFRDIYNMFCGEDGRLSLRRIMSASIFAGIIRVVEAIISGLPIPEYVLGSLIMFCLVLIGIVSAPAFVRSITEKSSKKTQIKSETVIEEPLKED